MRRALIFLIVAVFTQDAAAQSLAPMRGEFATYAERFAIRLTARNPYTTPKRFEVRVFEKNWRESMAQAVTPSLLIAPGESRPFIVTGQNDGSASRILYVCVISDPLTSRSGSAVRGEVCGKYRILARSR